MIRLNNVNKQFGKTVVYQNTSYQFKHNSLTCFYGPSGSGKTTLFNLLAGFDRQYQGEISINNQCLNDLQDSEMASFRFNNIGFVFQNYHLIKGYTAIENVLMASHLNAEDSDEDKFKRALELLTSLKLEAEMNQKIETLSGGQKQRVAIARALINNPAIILADEPTGALDRESSQMIMGLLKEIAKSKTVILITHDDEVLEYADEIITLEEHQIKQIKCHQSEMQNDGIKNNKTVLSKIKKQYLTKYALKNVKINVFKYLLAAIMICLATATFVSSLSSKSISEQVMKEFKEKNYYYNIGQIPLSYNGQIINEDLTDIYEKISSKKEFENVYLQYHLEQITLKNGDRTVEIQLKSPTALPNETLAYGKMPREGYNEVALASNVANRLSDDIKGLIGQEISLDYEDKNGERKSINLNVTGLTNSQYQDFIVSSHVEKELYKTAMGVLEEEVAISFTVKDFDQIPSIYEELKEMDIYALTKADEIIAFQTAFNNMIKLFTLVSYLILTIGVIVSSIILYKIYSQRQSEVSILCAIGYKDRDVKNILFKESIIFSMVVLASSIGVLFILNHIAINMLGYGLGINIKSIFLLIGLDLFITLGLCNMISGRLLKKDKSLALR